MIDVAIIGGGFFGCYLAEYLSGRGNRVIVFEADENLMQGASLLNQARVHNGYHYPRSLITGARSRVSYTRFLDEFSEAAVATDTHRYLVARLLSKVSARQFEAFCTRIGARFEPDDGFLRRHCDPRYVEAAYICEEAVFDSQILREMMLERLHRSKVEIRTGHEISSIGGSSGGAVELRAKVGKNHEDFSAREVFCCAYDGINPILRRSGLSVLPFKQEFTEISIVDVPGFLQQSGLTVMCGPFFSLLPHPISKKHTFSHVRYTPQVEYIDGKETTDFDALLDSWQENRRSNFIKIKTDAARYVPELEKVSLSQSQWAIKTVLQASELNDSRPIFMGWNAGLKNFHCVLGGKIDNVYDMIEYFETEF